MPSAATTGGVPGEPTEEGDRGSDLLLGVEGVDGVEDVIVK